MLPVFEGNGWPLTLDTKDFIYMLLLKRRDKFLWTIPVEFKFYFLLPLIMAVLVVTLRKRLVPTLVALVVAVVAAFAFIEPVGSSSSPIPFMGVFLSGILLAVVHKAMSTRSEATTSVPSKSWPVLFEVVAWASAAAFVCTIPYVFGLITRRDIFTGHFHESLALFSAIWCLLILGMLHGKGLMRRLLEIPLFRGLGTVSYSLYLWHYGVVKLVSEHVGGPVWIKAWLAVLFSVAVAVLSYNCIERPVLQWSARRRSRALEAVAEPAQHSELVTKSATT
jgi:peptidoglycan/LPS O-acetylase OafA/YrhL